MRYKITIFILAILIVVFLISETLLVRYWIDMLAYNLYPLSFRGIIAYITGFCSLVVFAVPAVFIGWQYLRVTSSNPFLSLISAIAVLIITFLSIYVCLYHKTSFYFFDLHEEGKGPLSFIDLTMLMHDEKWMTRFTDYKINGIENYYWRIFHIATIVVTGFGLFIYSFLKWMKIKKNAQPELLPTTRGAAANFKR